MGTNFKKFKTGIGVVTAMLSAVLGLSVGGLSASLIWLLSKLELIASTPLYYILCALLGLAIAAIGYLTHLPTDRKVAKKIDDDLSLGERAQTMVEFHNESSAIHQLQRMDTESALGSTSLRKLRFGKLWLHAIAPLLAVAMLISAIAVPAASSGSDGGDVDPAFTFTPWQRQALLDLIEEVESSDMDTVPKTVAVTELALLVTVLDNVGRVSGMKSAVNTTLQAIYSVVDVANTSDHLSGVLESSDDERVANLGTAIGKLGALLVTEELSSLRGAILASDGKAILNSFSSSLSEAMDNPTVAGLPDGDPLCTALENFASALSAIDTTADTVSESEIDAALSQANGDMGSALLTQSVNKSMEGRITRRLMEIFGLKLSDITAEQGDGSTDDDGGEGNDSDLLPDDENGSAGGGLGTGEMTFGSNDLVYDPRKNAYVPYGEIIYEYHAIAMGNITDGLADPELEAIITRYFDALYNTTEDKD